MRTVPKGHNIRILIYTLVHNIKLSILVIQPSHCLLYCFVSIFLHRFIKEHSIRSRSVTKTFLIGCLLYVCMPNDLTLMNKKIKKSSRFKDSRFKIQDSRYLFPLMYRVINIHVHYNSHINEGVYQ